MNRITLVIIALAVGTMFGVVSGYIAYLVEFPFWPVFGWSSITCAVLILFNVYAPLDN